MKILSHSDAPDVSNFIHLGYVSASDVGLTTSQVTSVLSLIFITFIIGLASIIYILKKGIFRKKTNNDAVRTNDELINKQDKNSP